MVEQCVNHFIVISINIILLSSCSLHVCLRTHLLIIRFVYSLLFSLSLSVALLISINLTLISFTCQSFSLWSNYVVSAKAKQIKM